MNKKIYSRGFTIIELMVVIAVIGLLSAVILSVTNRARTSGAEAAVKANLMTVRSQSEVFAAATSGNIFLPTGGSTFSLNTCPVYNASGTNMLSIDRTIASAIAEATARGGNGNQCYNSASRWAVAVGISATSSWCIDSAGNSWEKNYTPALAINNLTFVCNP